MVDIPAEDTDVAEKLDVCCIDIQEPASSNTLNRK